MIDRTFGNWSIYQRESMKFSICPIGFESVTTCLIVAERSHVYQSIVDTLAFAQGPPDTSFLSQEPLEPCLEEGALENSTSDPEYLGISETGQGILETLPHMQNSAEIPKVSQGIIKKNFVSCLRISQTSNSFIIYLRSSRTYAMYP